MSQRCSECNQPIPYDVAQLTCPDCGNVRLPVVGPAIHRARAAVNLQADEVLSGATRYPITSPPEGHEEEAVLMRPRATAGRIHLGMDPLTVKTDPTMQAERQATVAAAETAATEEAVAKAEDRVARAQRAEVARAERAAK